MNLPTPVRESRPAVAGSRRRVTAIALAVVVAVVALVAAVLARTGTDPGAATGPSPASGPATPSTPATPATPATPGTSTPGTPTPSQTSSGVAGFGYVPLWPFASVDAAARWQQDTAGGQQSWGLDAGSTAVAFTRAFLGYSELTRVLTRKVEGDQAWIGVGAAVPEATTPAAVLHLVRIGTGPSAGRPWEVVGTADTSLSLTTPRYGATVGPALTVGGRITGVDESLTIQVRSLGQVLGRTGGIPAGGQDRPWSASLVLEPGAGGPAVVAVSTGGHLLAVERFAITGVRVRPSAGYVTAERALATLVTGGTYVGRCESVTSTPSGSRGVCSRQVAAAGARYLFRVGYVGTDNGFFAVLGRTATGRWVILDPRIAGPDVPADLGGPIRE